jgi:hypothetical protein
MPRHTQPQSEVFIGWPRAGRAFMTSPRSGVVKGAGFYRLEVEEGLGRGDSLYCWVNHGVLVVYRLNQRSKSGTCEVL